MDFPLYGNRFGYPHSSRYHDRHRQTPVELKPTPHRKVVMIPVVDGAERQLPPSRPKPDNDSDYAVKIQKVVRGYLVRKSVKKICEINSEVDEIEKSMLVEETIDLIRKDGKERLKVNEMLMRVLLRLDSVRGVDCGVRDARRRVIKKVIRLQEMVDSLAVTNAEEEGPTATSEPTLAINDSVVSDNVITEEVRETDNASECAAESIEMIGSQADSSGFPRDEEVESEDLLKKQPVNGGDDGQDEDGGCGGIKKKKDNRELLEKMMEENEKMMGLMAQLFRRNEMQTRLLDTLSQRVEQLERALVCGKSKKMKKKTNKRNPPADCLESTRDCKKFGNR